MKTLALALFLGMAAQAPALSPVLLVDDDNGTKTEEQYIVQCKEAGISYHYWETQSMGTPLLEQLVQYPTVVWLTGQKGDISHEEEERIKEYLDDRAGRRSCLMAGSRLAHQLRSGFNDQHQLLGWYFNVRYVGTETDVRGVVHAPCDLFYNQLLSQVFRQDAPGEYSFSLHSLEDIVTPNDGDKRKIIFFVAADMRNALAVYEKKQNFRTIFVSFDTSADVYGINEVGFLKLCIEWLQR